MDIDKDVKNMPKLKRKGEKNIFLTIFKVIVCFLLILLQIFLMLTLYTTTFGMYKYATILYNALKIYLVCYMLYKKESYAYKISWLLFMLFFPITGLLAYFLWGSNKIGKKKAILMQSIRLKTNYLLENNDDVLNELKSHDFYTYSLAKYIKNTTRYPIYKNQKIKYFKLGEEFFDELKQDIKEAKEYIFMEFFIVSKGKLLDEISEILIKKANEGIKIELIVDTLGSLFRFPKSIRKKLENSGIKIFMFNPLSIILNSFINNRDHRKIIVIDGKKAYTGGVNLADEYANIIEKYGHWKDVGIKVEGKVCKNYLMMYLRNKEQLTGEKICYDDYFEKIDKIKEQKGNGLIMAFPDGPDNKKNPIENSYIKLVNMAKEYVYISTPYFVISEQLMNALTNAALSGVNIKIIMPHIPDKKFVQLVTRSNYETLLKSGIEVYEYKPGFIHAKTILVDDKMSIVGTSNFDYRSFHLNFECVNLSYQTGVEKKIKDDFETTLQKCIKIDLNKWLKRSKIEKLKETILSAFSPML